jgi:hypothetical protein
LLVRNGNGHDILIGDKLPLGGFVGQIHGQAPIRQAEHDRGRPICPGRPADRPEPSPPEGFGDDGIGPCSGQYFCRRMRSPRPMCSW